MARRVRPPPTAAAPGPPGAAELQALLGSAHGAFQALIDRRPRAISQWRRYSKNSPWVLKVSEGDRTLFYVNPASGSFEVTVLLGPRATTAALGGRVSKKLHGSIQAAKRYAEGRPVRVVVRRERDLAGVEELIAVKLDPEGRRLRS